MAELSQLARSDGGSLRLFLESDMVVDSTDGWIPYLPGPGRYKHPRYGEIDITTERNDRFVKNFNTGVYQKTVPLDAEHETKLSGAAAWVNELRLNEDGSADARVDWTDRGKAFLEGRRFRYVSPEWYDTWTDPANGKMYNDVVIGGALTTRPFFKESSLRPLVAREGGLWAFDEDESTDDSFVFSELEPLSDEEPRQMAGNKMPPFIKAKIEDDDEDEEDDEEEDEEEEPMPPPRRRRGAEVETRRDSDMVAERRLTELEFQVGQLDNARQMAEDQLRAAQRQLAEREHRDLVRRYSETIDGGGADPAFLGDKATHLRLRMKMSEQFGEDSPEVRDYLSIQQAIATQAETAAVFDEIGTSRRGVTAGATEQLEDRASKMAAEKSITFSEAMMIVARDNPTLYERYRAEMTQRV